MANFLITYDLRKKRDYEAIYKKMNAWKAVQLLESVWLARLNGTAGQVAEALRKVADFDDGIAVVEIAKGADWAVVEPIEGGHRWLLQHVSP